MNYTHTTTTHIRIIREHLHLTDREIGKLIGMSRDQVYSARKRYGIKKCQLTFCKIGANYGRGKRAA